MEGTTSKAQVLKPVILKAGVPLAVSLAGFIYAWIMAKKSISKASSSSPNEANSHETNTHNLQGTKHEETFHSLASMEDEKHTTTIDANDVAECSKIHDTPCLEQEISGLRSSIEGMQIRELAVSLQFDQYCILKEQESMLKDINNMLSLETSRVEFLNKEISSIETQNMRLENFVVQYLRVIEQLESWKSKNRMLQRKFQKLLRKSKAQSRLAKEQALKIKAEEAEILRSHDALQTSIDAIDKLEDEIRELQRVLDQLQDEKNELLKKLDIAEKSYASKIEVGDVISWEDYKQVLDELEQIKKERADEVKELIYLRWTNACLRHELTRHQEQQQNQDREHIELEFGGSDGVVHYDSEHELHDNSLLEHHNVPSLDAAHHNSSACFKRSKFLRRLKRWVEGSEKERLRHSVP